MTAKADIILHHFHSNTKCDLGCVCGCVVLCLMLVGGGGEIIYESRMANMNSSHVFGH